ncbi:MAG TPA: DUF4352 domain-containing protein [Thermomicrobiales bacterium]|nr:DUF4352 domain-containing protein [Thermomicrobiales bacterium]
MHRIASLLLIALLLVACGGGDDDANDSSSNSAPTATIASSTTVAGSTAAPAQPTTQGAAATMPTESVSTPTVSTGGGGEDVEGAPTNASADFPDVRVPLEAGSSGEVGSMDPDPFAATDTLDENSKVKVTINEVLDPATVDGTIFSPEEGNRWFAINVTMEATGSEVANTGEWTLSTTDGAEYTNSIVLGSTPDITYGSIEASTSTEGIVVFEIPEGAEVAWILMSPTIFVGGNLVFVN